MDRLINYAFLIFLIFLFVLESGTDERYRIGIALAAALLFSVLAFVLQWLTLDGSVSAVVFGTVVLGIGGWQAAILILTFFITSTLISRDDVIVIEETAQVYAERERRDGVQVWSNGFWFALCILAGHLLNAEFVLMGAAGAIATATADTWATELGSKRFKVETYLLKNFEKVRPGTDGGISLPGTLGALAGSLLMAVVTVLCYGYSWLEGASVIFLAGFLGCFIDSYLGATVQQNNMTVSFGSADSYLNFSLDNNFVNWAATGVGSLAALITNLLIQ